MKRMAPVGFIGLVLFSCVFMGLAYAQPSIQTGGGSWELHCVFKIGFDAVRGKPTSAAKIWAKVLWSAMPMNAITLEIPSIDFTRLPRSNKLEIRGAFIFVMGDSMTCDGDFILAFMLLRPVNLGSGVFYYSDRMHVGYFGGNLDFIGDEAYRVMGLLFVYMKQ